MGRGEWKATWREGRAPCVPTLLHHSRQRAMAVLSGPLQSVVRLCAYSRPCIGGLRAERINILPCCASSVSTLVGKPRWKV